MINQENREKNLPSTMSLSMLFCAEIRHTGTSVDMKGSQVASLRTSYPTGCRTYHRKLSQ